MPDSVDVPARRAPFSDEEIGRARAYHRPLDLLWPAGVAIDVAVLALAAFTGLGEAIFDPLDGLPWWAQTLLYAAALVAILAVLTAPLGYWAGYRREHAWGFSTQTLGGWLGDRAKGLAIGVVLSGLALLGLVALARALPAWWPAVASIAAAGLVLLLGFVAPVVLEPVFNRFDPLEDDDLVASLRALADGAGVPVQHVLVADASRRTTKQNAYVSGFGRTRRLVLYDTLVRGGDPREVRVILAHELGHRRAGHIAKGVVLGMAGAVGLVLVLWACLHSQGLLDALGITGPGDPQVVAFVLLLVTVVQVVAAPAGAALSRAWEREADRISLELTGDPEAFETMMRGLALANLADLDPPRAVYLARFSHPTPPERIQAARQWTLLPHG